MGKIGDLWVRLGLKKDDFSKGMDDAKKDVSGFGSAMSRMAGLAKAVWAAVAAAVVKFATDAVKLTQRWGDQWNVTMSGVRGAYQSFVRDLSNGVGWGELFQNMRDAYRSAKEGAAALDEVFERKVSFSYQEAAINKQIAELRNITSDTSQSDAKRKKAAQDAAAKAAAAKDAAAKKEAAARDAAAKEAAEKAAKEAAAKAAAEKAAREAAEKAEAERKREITPEEWKRAKKSLKFSNPAVVKTQDGEVRATISINGNIYGDGDYMSTTLDGVRFTWRVRWGDGGQKLLLEHVRARRVK